jgi:LysR family transcriptional regulator, nitrogen assimilation regulatory protein
MELRQLTYFVSIARAGSFSKAASLLNIAQPALSRQMALLERELGVMLLTRNGRGAVPTAAGELFLERVSDVLQDLDQAKWQATSFSAMPSGVLRIGVPLSISKLLTADLLDRVRKKFPRVSLQISEAWTAHIHRDLLERKLDLGVLNRSQLGREMEHRRLAREPICLIKASDRPSARKLPLCGLQQFPLVLPPRPNGMRLLLDRVFERHGIEPRIVLESEVWSVIIDVVQKGIAYTLSPCREVKAELKSGKLEAIPFDRPLYNELCLVRTSHGLPPFADPIFALLAQGISALLRAETR